jgi:hypothetical protein
VTHMIAKYASTFNTFVCNKNYIPHVILNVCQIDVLSSL